MVFIFCYLDHTTTRIDALTYNYYSTQQYYVLETPLGSLTPKLRKRFHLPTYYIVITTAVIITVCSCISIVAIAVCVKKSTLAWRKVKSKVLTSANKVNPEQIWDHWTCLCNNYKWYWWFSWRDAGWNDKQWGLKKYSVHKEKHIYFWISGHWCY